MISYNESKDAIEQIFRGSGVSDGFSDRFNSLLDHAGFRQGRGRATDAIDFFGTTKSVMYRCLSDNHCPKDLIVYIDQLLKSKKLSSSLDRQVIVVWLISGLANPFKSKDGQTSVNQRHAELMNLVVSTFEQEAKKAGEDLSEANDEELVYFYYLILADMVKRKATSPSLKIIKKILSDNPA